MIPIVPGVFVRLRHAPDWHGKVLSIQGNAAVVLSECGSSIPDVGGWPLPLNLLETF